MDQHVLVGDDIFEVEEIVGMKKSDGRWLYRVRWKGYGAQSDTWEPKENLLLCKDMIEQYQTKNALKSSKKHLKSSLVPVEESSKGSNTLSTNSHFKAKATENPKGSANESNPSQTVTNVEAETDTFWKDLSEGRIHIIDEDMYSRVKGRAAKKSRKAQETNQTNSSTKEPTVEVNEPIRWRSQNRKRKAGVLQTLSQSFDNSMNSVEILRNKHLRKKRKFWTRKVVAKNNLVVKKSTIINVEQVNIAPAKEVLKIKVHKTEKQTVESNENKKDPDAEIPNQVLAESTHKDSGAQDPASQLTLFQDLISAIEKCDCDLISSLYSRFCQTEIESLSKAENTLLLTAVIGGHWPSIKTLLQNGISVNCVSSNGTTAMMIACQKGDVVLVDHLLEHGAQKDNLDSSGQTALMIACSMGYKEAVHLLLNSGANFAAINNDGMDALNLAKLSKQSEIQELLTSHISHATAAFEREVSVTVSNTAHIVHALFPLHCFSLSESTTFTISFDHECQNLKPGIGYLLFIAHADVALSSVRSRLYGPCAVKYVMLNNKKQPSLTEGANYVFSFCPLLNGRNVLTIATQEALQSNVKLLVCAYKAELMREVSSELNAT